MKGLILKDLYLLKETIMTTLVILGILVLYCLFRKFSLGLVIVPALIFAATATSSLKIDWGVNWDKIAVTMPIYRRDIVRSKFWELVFLCLSGTIIGIICVCLQNIWFYSLNFSIIFNFGLLSLSLGLMGGSIHILLAYKFGGKNLENSEILLFAAYGIAVTVIGIIILIMKIWIEINFNSYTIIPLILIISAGIIHYLSYRITASIFSKKTI